MGTVISAHGDRREGEAKTFVPVGTTVSFYGGEDELLPQTFELAAISSGAAGTPTDVYEGGEEVWNYQLYSDEDEIIARIMQLDPGSHEIKYVGPDIPDGTQFCGSPDECKEANAHTCDGILGQFEGELIVLACRGIEGDDDAKTSEQYGGDADDPLADLDSDLDAWVDQFEDKAVSDPDAAAAEFDALPEATKAMVMPYHSIGAWNQARYIQYYAGQRDLDGLINQIEENDVDKDWFKFFVDNVQTYEDALLRLVVDYLEPTVDDMVAEGNVDTDVIFEHFVNVTDWLKDRTGIDVEDPLESYGPYQTMIGKIQTAEATTA